jgi:lysophospholipase L1-like esterase
MDNAPNRKNWLERNPKKVIGTLLLLAIGGLAVGTEKLLARKNHGLINPAGIQRYIKLREFNPLYRDVLVPSQEGLRIADGLAPESFVVRVDRQGFIMPAKIHDHPDLTIAFLGGSTTECVYVMEPDRFPYLAGRLLERQTHLKVNSYNAGRSGNNTLHCINVLMNKVVNLKPDLVVLMENINDLAILMYDKTYWNDHPSRSPLIEKPPNFKTVGKDLEQIFHLVRDITFPNLSRELKQLSPFGPQGKRDEFQGVRGKKIIIDQEFLVREFSLNLQTFINICRAREITPVLMTQASRLTDSPDPLIKKLMQKLEVNQGITYTDFKAAFDRLNQTIRDVGAKNQVLVIDLAREIPPVKENIADVTHFNDQGSRLVAARIANDLTPIIARLAKKPLSGNDK